MIGYFADKDKIVDSEGKVCAFNNWLGWLIDNDRYENKIAYDLDYFVACTLRHLKFTREEGQKLLNNRKLYLPDIGYTLKYYPGKVFTIDYGFFQGHPYTYFYNAKQYTDVHYSNNENEARSIEYAQDRANKAKEVGEQVLATYHDIGITTDSLTSPIRAFEKSGLMPRVPTIDDIPEEYRL